MKDAGGPGLEFHQFDHIDMPLDEVCDLYYQIHNFNIIKFYFQDSGFYVLGKFANEEKTEIHLTAFKVLNHLNLKIITHTCQVPKMATVYTPGGIIHTNNYQECTIFCVQYILI